MAKAIRPLFLYVLLLGSWLGSHTTLYAQQVHPGYMDGTLYVRVARTTPAIQLPLGSQPDSLVAALAPWPGLQAVARQHSLSRIAHIFTLKNDTLQRTYVCTFADHTGILACMEALQALPYVELAERRPLYRVSQTPNDPTTSLWHLQKIRAFEAWDLATGSSNVRVAVVDDAVRSTHQDLSANMLAGRDVADLDNNANPPAADASNFSWSHGTHCAGIVSAVTNNGVGIPSIGYNVRMIPVKTAPDDEDGKSLPFAVEGVQWASQQSPRPDVISMSWGGPGSSSTEQTFFQNVANLGILLVAAAGNSSTNTQFYPAAYTSIVAVAATGQTDAKASFSNFGSWVDIAAPGVSIFSTVAGSGGSNSSYQSYDGTSMACPLVSGLLALAKSYKPTATNAEILSCLYSSADNINAQNPNFVGQLGAGRINAFAMLQCLGAAAPVACWGQQTYSATSGNLSDGSGNNDYSSDANCSWLIQPNDGGRVRLTFSAFATEATHDVVRVYDGTTTAATLLGTYSGSSLPPQLTSTGNALLITFTTDESVTAAGFSASWTTLPPTDGNCSGSVTLTANSGTFSDGSGASNYPNNADCTWLIQPTNGGRVQLDFTAFSTESCCDKVQVFDGSTTDATRIGNFSGSTLPQAVTSTGNALLVSFRSDFSVGGAGFSANWTSLTTTTQCSGTTTLTDNSGTFSDGSGTNNYAADLDCQWVIQPNDGGLVQLSFSSFDTEFQYDEVRVYDGTTTAAPLLGTYSGSAVPASVTSTGNGMLLRFTSDESIARAGFSASWTSIPTTCSGHVVLQNTQGTISDGPDNYRAFDNCSWHIATPGASGIALTFTQFNTEEDYDFVQVYDGANAAAPLLATYTGSLSTPFTVTANSGQMYVQFSSDLSVQAAGFTATYQAQGVAASRGAGTPAVAYKLYPNPATDHMVLELDSPATLTLVNALGQPVGTYAHRQLSRLEVGHLPAGVYSLRVQLPGHPPFTIKCTLQ